MDKKKVIIIFILLIILLGMVYIPGYLKIKRLKRQNRDLERQIAGIEQENKRLEEEQQKMISDPLYLENVARRKLGVVKKGEVVYKVVPPPQN